MTVLSGEDDARRYVATLCDKAAMDRLDGFVEELIHENAQQNLIARSSENHIWQRHIADSAQLLEFSPDDPDLWLDLGTGAGLPGLVIAMMRPGWRIMLVESRRKRIDWLDRMMSLFNLKHCRVAGCRLEQMETVLASVISARAFAPLDRLLRLSTRFSTGDTLWLLPKGRSAAQELQESPDRFRQMFHVEQSRTDPDAGIICGRFGTQDRRRR